MLECRRNKTIIIMANKKLLSLLTMLLLFIGQFSVNAQDAQTSLPQSYNRVGISFRDFNIGLPDINKEKNVNSDNFKVSFGMNI